MLMCTVLTFAMCADPNVAGAISFGDLTVPIVWSRVQTGSCPDVGQQSAGSEAGLTRFETAWASQQSTPDTEGTYSGRVVVHMESAEIDMTAFAWPHMSRAEGDALRRLYQATLWHELGHLRTAKASIDAFNADNAISAQSAPEYTAAAKQRGNVAMARLNADQVEYDRVAGHGLRQDTLPPPLGGPDTIINCSER